jgi:dipeptidyl aminopeptidase/acylaminoacyl peptidase
MNIRVFSLIAGIGVSVVGLLFSPVGAQQPLKSGDQVSVSATALKPPVIPVETFMRRQEFAAMSISPKGDKLAALVPVKDRDNLVVIDLAKRTRQIITGFTENDVIDFLWINNDRLFLRVADGRDALGQARYRGTYAINTDGSALRDLTGLAGLAPLRTIMGDTKGEIFVQMRLRNRAIADVYRLNTTTGRSELLTFENPGETQSWMLDWDNEPRLAVGVDPDSTDSIIWYRADPKAKWEKLWKNSFDEAADNTNPLAFTPDGKGLYVSSNKGRDKYAIMRYDLSARALGEVVLEHPLVDVTGGLIWNRAEKKLAGIALRADVTSIKWLDPELDKLQRMIDASVPGRSNVISFNATGDTKRLLVTSWSATDPGMTYLYDATAKTLEPLPQRRSWINPEHMSPRTFITYKARDGMVIPAYVTIPKGTTGKGLPLVVNIHGGPHVRVYDDNPWDRYSEAPFFANRGYVVLEPEPRGAGGFGRKHLSSGYRQWGGTMQDDITDGVLHLIKEGIVDKNRVCLYGGSYGGYATLMGLVKEPDMFRCGLPWIAQTDNVLRVSDTLGDTNNSRFDPSAYYNLTLGNIKTERDMLERTSPVNNANKIKAPVLLVMGELDQRIPLRHGTSMRDAMNRAGVRNEFVILKGEGHGFNKQENIVEFFTRAEKFFAQHIGDDAQKAAAGVK